MVQPTQTRINSRFCFVFHTLYFFVLCFAAEGTRRLAYKDKAAILEHMRLEKNHITPLGQLKLAPALWAERRLLLLNDDAGA
jgi:hypothetical protein